MSDLCVCMRDVISEFKSEIEGSLCALMLCILMVKGMYVTVNAMLSMSVINPPLPCASYRCAKW